MSYEAREMSSPDQVRNSGPGTLTPSVFTTLEPRARPITTPSIDHTVAPFTSTTLGTRSV